jgi:hypothetical protein
VITDFINDQDIEVIQRGRSFCLLNEAPEGEFINFALTIEKLDRDVPAEGGVSG